MSRPAKKRTKKAAKAEIVPLPQTLDMLEPGIIVLQGPPASGQMTFVLQTLLSAAYEKNLAVGYVSDVHPTFVARQLQVMAFRLGITIKNICLFPDTPIEAIEPNRLRELIRSCNLKILCIDDFPAHIEAKAAKAISYETGCCILVVIRPPDQDLLPLAASKEAPQLPAPQVPKRRRRLGYPGPQASEMPIRRR
jgi:hypothetical protein